MGEALECGLQARFQAKIGPCTQLVPTLGLVPKSQSISRPGVGNVLNRPARSEEELEPEEDE